MCLDRHKRCKSLSADERFHQFTFTLSKSAGVDFYTFGWGAPLDTVLYVYQQDDRGRWGRPLHVADDTETSRWAKLETYLPPGEYRVLFTGYSLRDVGDFEFEVQCEGPGCYPPCELEGRLVEHGTTAELDDGCNTCACEFEGGSRSTLLCTEELCEACTYDGQSVAIGDSVPSTDGCNECTCFSGDEGAELYCTELACGELSERTACEWEGAWLELGDSVDAGDGCNTCQCLEGPDGPILACTAAHCGDNPFSCFFNDDWYSVGESAPAGDGCNTCTCTVGVSDRATMFCTEAVCPSP